MTEKEINDINNLVLNVAEYMKKCYGISIILKNQREFYQKILRDYRKNDAEKDPEGKLLHIYYTLQKPFLAGNNRLYNYVYLHFYYLSGIIRCSYMFGNYKSADRHGSGASFVWYGYYQLDNLLSSYLGLEKSCQLSLDV